MQSFAFTPSSVGNRVPYRFQPVLDGNGYAAMVYWNLAGQRWYIALTNPNGLLVFDMALSGSPIGQTVDTLEWENGFALGSTVVPTGLRIGDTLDLVIADTLPDGYNGLQRCLITGPNTFSYPLATDPGLITNYGTLSFDIDMLAGYQFTSTLVYRETSRVFEVQP
jgi:hypothetical protein